MFPLILLVFGLGAALAAYESSSRVRARFDDYLHAIRGAQAAHRAADSHLSNAAAAMGAAVQHEAPLRSSGALAPGHAPGASVFSEGAAGSAAQIMADASVDHLVSSMTANQQAAQSTAEAGKLAKPGAERDAVAVSAAKVLERGKKIEEALTHLGVGQCGVRSYARVTFQVRDEILARLHAEGMTVTGDNPWDVDPQLAGVRLRAVWDPAGEVLKLIVTASAPFVPCAVIWARIDSKLRGIIEEGGKNSRISGHY